MTALSLPSDQDKSALDRINVFLSYRNPVLQHFWLSHSWSRILGSKRHIDELGSHPHLDLVVIPSADKQRLTLVEHHSADWPLVLVEAVDESPHAIVP